MWIDESRHNKPISNQFQKKEIKRKNQLQTKKSSINLGKPSET